MFNITTKSTYRFMLYTWIKRIVIYVYIYIELRRFKKVEEAGQVINLLMFLDDIN